MEKKKTNEMILNEMEVIFKEMGRNDLVEWCLHQKELINKKRESARKNNVGKNEDIAKLVVQEMLKINQPIRITDLMFKSQEIKEKQYTNQRLSSIMNKLVDNGDLYKKTVKRKTYFSVNPIEDNFEEDVK